MAAFQIFFKRRGCIKIHAVPACHPHHQQVLFFRHAGLFVVRHFGIAIKRQSVLHISTDAEDGHGLICGSQGGEPVGKRTRGVSTVENVNHMLGGADLGNAKEGANAIEKENKHSQHDSGYEAKPCNAIAFDNDENQ